MVGLEGAPAEVTRAIDALKEAFHLLVYHAATLGEGQRFLASMYDDDDGRVDYGVRFPQVHRILQRKLMSSFKCVVRMVCDVAASHMPRSDLYPTGNHFDPAHDLVCGTLTTTAMAVTAQFPGCDFGVMTSPMFVPGAAVECQNLYGRLVNGRWARWPTLYMQPSRLRPCTT